MPIYELNGEAPELPSKDKYFVADTAVVIGRVRLKENVGIWFGSVLRGDNEWIEIGDSSNIQDGCTLHTDMGFPLTVGARCTVGHNVILHGCTIGDDCLIGMGAVVLTGARIGANSIVGAGALVTENKEFPPNSLIMGAPARVVRPADERTKAMIEQGCQVYVANARRFAAGLKRIG
ncbi:MAG TPA: gamma carbonic anhydrase family protein [Xanthobacteraceae bacterium]|nr:gamma carbonic anhydrase family protein [Xanthobacteraceae bacterium]